MPDGGISLAFAAVLEGAATAAQIATVVAVTAMVMSVAYSAYTLATMPSQTDFKSETQGRTQVVRSAVAPHRIIYGRCMVSGPLVAVFSSGENNKFLYLVVVLAAHKCHSIGDVYLGDTLADDPKYRKTVTESLTSTDHVFTVADPGGWVEGISVYGPGGAVDSALYSVAGGVYTLDESLPIFDVESGYPIPYSFTFVHSYAVITKYLGDPDQEADASLITNAKDAAGNACWSTNHRLRGRAYVVVRLEYDINIFSQGIPNIKAVVEGAEDIYDPRTGDTGYTDNAALCMRDYLTKKYGLRCTDSRINDVNFIAAANVCDETVGVAVGTGAGYTTDATGYEKGIKLLKLISGSGTILAGDIVTITVTAGTYGGVTYESSTTQYTVEAGLANGLLTLAGGLLSALPPVACAVTVASARNEARYTCNGSFTLDQKPIDTIKKMLTACLGRLVWSQGQYSIFPAVYRYPVATLTEDDLRGDISVTPAVSRRQRINTVRGTYVDPLQSWQQVDFPPQQDADALAADDGEELAASIDLPFTISSAAAQRMAHIHLQRELLGCTIDFPAKLTAFRLQPGDNVRFRVNQLGWSDPGKEFRVIGWKLSQEGGVDLQGREESM